MKPMSNGNTPSDKHGVGASRREFLAKLTAGAAGLSVSGTPAMTGLFGSSGAPGLPAETSAAGTLDAPSGLLCELMAFPERTLLVTPHPSFAWIVTDSAPEAVQSAYQIQVASDRERLAQNRPDLWDSGKVASDQSTGIVYRGGALISHSDYFWRVRTWNRGGQASVYSAAQRFRMGDLTAPRVTARYPIAQSEIKPVRIVNKGDGHYFLDFGRAAFGRLRFSASAAPWTGQTMQVLLGEARLPDDTVDPHPGGSVRFLKADLSLAADRPTFLPQPLQTVLPFRYGELRGYPGLLRADTLCQIAEHYPFDETASRFHSSHPTLNAVWELCKYTIKATSFLGVYIDGDRERKPYEADAYINQLGHYCVDREFTLARYSHEYLMTHATWPTEWPMHSVLMAWADYLYTGDSASLAHYYEDLKAKTLQALAREDGLISTTTGLVTPPLLASLHVPRLQDIVDWPAGERDGYVFGDINTVVNAFHYQALQLMAGIARALGKNAEAATFAAKASRVQQAFQAKLYDGQRGLYRDGEGIDHCSLHANMFPLAFGLVPRARQAAVVAFLKSRGMACSVYGAHYLLEALYNAHEGDYALQLLTAKTGRSWGHMLYEVGTTITLEAWDNRYKPNQDWNHAWGAAPANIIPRRLMGIEPIQPGGRVLRIKPQVGRLKEGSMELSTIRGKVHVAFQSTPDEAFHLTVTLPANTTATVYIPQIGGNLGRLWENKKERNARVEDGFYRIESVGAGTHQFLSSRR